MTKVVDSSVFKRAKKKPQDNDDPADKILDGTAPEGAWKGPERSHPNLQASVDDVEDDPMVQMTIRCPQSVRKRFESMARGTTRKDKKTYGVQLEILLDEYEGR